MSPAFVSLSVVNEKEYKGWMYRNCDSICVVIDPRNMLDAHNGGAEQNPSGLSLQVECLWMLFVKDHL